MKPGRGAAMNHWPECGKVSLWFGSIAGAEPETRAFPSFLLFRIGWLRHKNTYWGLMQCIMLKQSGKKTAIRVCGLRPRCVLRR